MARRKRGGFMAMLSPVEVPPDRRRVGSLLVENRERFDNADILAGGVIGCSGVLGECQEEDVSQSSGYARGGTHGFQTSNPITRDAFREYGEESEDSDG